MAKKDVIMTEQEVREELNLPDGVTVVQYQNWKATYKNRLRKLVIERENGDEIEVVVCKPSRQPISMYEKYIDKDPSMARKLLIKACVLSHKEVVQDADDLFYSVSTAIIELIDPPKARIENF